MTAIGPAGGDSGGTRRPVSGAGTRTGVGLGLGVGVGVGLGEGVRTGTGETRCLARPAAAGPLPPGLEPPGEPPAASATIADHADQGKDGDPGQDRASHRVEHARCRLRDLAIGSHHGPAAVPGGGYRTVRV